MEVRVDERRRHQLAGRVHDLRGLGLQRRLQGRDAAAGDADVDVLAAIGQRAVSKNQIEHGIPCGRFLLFMVLRPPFFALSWRIPSGAHGAGFAGP